MTGNGTLRPKEYDCTPPNGEYCMPLQSPMHSTTKRARVLIFVLTAARVPSALHEAW
jgi:hypothetical protein